MSTVAVAQRAWDDALRLDDAGVKDPTVRRSAMEAWLVAADAAEEAGLHDDARSAREMAEAERHLLQPSAMWPSLGRPWREPLQVGDAKASHKSSGGPER